MWVMEFSFVAGLPADGCTTGRGRWKVSSAGSRQLVIMAPRYQATWGSTPTRAASRQMLTSSDGYPPAPAGSVIDHGVPGEQDGRATSSSEEPEGVRHAHGSDSRRTATAAACAVSRSCRPASRPGQRDGALHYSRWSPRWQADRGRRLCGQAPGEAGPDLSGNGECGSDSSAIFP